MALNGAIVRRTTRTTWRNDNRSGSSSVFSAASCIGPRIRKCSIGGVAHTWQATASAGMSIGQKGMIVAAKALSLTGTDLFSDHQLVLDAKAEFRHRLEGKTYKSVIPLGQNPPLDSRNK